MWYYDEQGTSRGPVDEAEIRRLMGAGRVTPTTRVWRNGFADWVAAGQTELAHVGPPPLSMPSSVPVVQGVYAPQVAPGVYAPQMTLGGYGAQLSGVHFAGFWIRAAALLLDGLFIGMVSWGIKLPIVLAIGSGSSDDSVLLGIVLFITTILGLIGTILYHSLFVAGRWQATPGKRIVGIRIVKVSGQRLGFGAALGRYFAQFVSAFTLGIGYMMAGWTEQKKALHDMIVETRVIYGRT